MDNLRAEFQMQIQLYLKSIEPEIQSLFKQGIQEAIYDYYTPVSNGYSRTYMFLNSVRTHVDLATGKMYVYSDINTGYYSAVSGEDTTSSISNWLNQGHSDSTGIGGQYHNYTPRNYLSRCYELINNKFPFLDLEIIEE